MSDSHTDSAVCDDQANAECIPLDASIGGSSETLMALPCDSADTLVESVTNSNRRPRFGSGCVVNEFHIRQQIGRGGMAYVYEAWQESLQRSVALKVLPFWSSSDSRQIARLQNEARALAQLEHPNIVPVYAVGEDRGIHYMAMRLIDGASLDQVIKRLRQLHAAGTSSDHGKVTRTTPDDADPACSPDLAEADSLSEKSQDVGAVTAVTGFFDQSGKGRFDAVARFGVTLARALHAAHEYGVVHRDIKPSNILVDREGRAWVADFGLAHCDTSTHLTRTGAFVGTPRYASPEQASGESALVDHRTDIYSLGLTLFEMATLGPAFDRSPGCPDSDRYDCQPPRARKLCPDIPPDLENIILKAASPARDERYATARELADDLDRFLAGEATQARRPTALEQITRWSRRHVRALVGFTTVVMILLTASVISTGVVLREKAKTQAALKDARQHFHQARTVVDEFGAELTEQLALVPGTEHIRRALLLDTIEYYRSFIEQSEDNTELHEDLATALNKIALLTERVGSPEEAIAAHEEALAAFKRLSVEHPNSLNCRASLALCENNIAFLLSKTDDTAQAERRFRHAIMLQEELAAANPDHARCRRELGLTKNNLALLLGRSPERWSEATTLYRSAIDLFKTAAKLEPEHRQTQQFLATSCSNLASLHDRENPDIAEESLNESIRILETLVAAEPHRVDFGRDLALSLNNLGALHSRLGEHAASAQAYQRASQIQHELLNQTPHSQVYRRDLAVSENNIGLALARADSDVEAEKAFRRAIAFQFELVAERPDDLNDAASLAGIWNNLGMVLEHRDRLPEACDAYEQGIAILTELSGRSPGASGVRQNLSRTYFNYSRALLELDSVDRAVEFALRRRNLWPGNPTRLLSVAEQLAVAAARVDGAKASQHSRISPDACRRLISETLSAAIQAGLDPTVVRESHMSDWLFPQDTPPTKPSGKQIGFEAESA